MVEIYVTIPIHRSSKRQERKKVRGEGKEGKMRVEGTGQATEGQWGGTQGGIPDQPSGERRNFESAAGS